jgi:hypothetical protein
VNQETRENDKETKGQDDGPDPAVASGNSDPNHHPADAVHALRSPRRLTWQTGCCGVRAAAAGLILSVRLM